MAAALYGTRHPYGYTEIGTEASNKAMTRDDMQAFWKQNFVPNNAALVVAGDITDGGAAAAGREGVRRLAEGHAGAAGARRARRRPPRACHRRQAGRAADAAARRARSACRATTPDYRPMQVMNKALGGLFSSRINMNLREEHGYTYGAQLAVRVPPDGRAVPRAIRRPHRRDRAGGDGDLQGSAAHAGSSRIPADELALAKDSLVRSLPAQFETQRTPPRGYTIRLHLRSRARLLEEVSRRSRR